MLPNYTIKGLMSRYPHTSVLINQCLAGFEGLRIQTFVDATLGAGGHAEALLSAHPEIEHLIGIDQDKSALEIARQRLKDFPGVNLSLLHGNFSDLHVLLEKINVPQVDAILVDLGVSSMQIDQPERGFSFMREGPLDMRMNKDQTLTAADIVNTWEEKHLVEIFFKYGEEKESRKAARAICFDREKAPFETTLQLASMLERVLKRSKRDLHPATKIFQALRIAVNRELERLEQFLPQALAALNRGGRLETISFHSLEDRIIKQRFAYYASDKESTSGIGGHFIDKKPQAIIISRRPLIATDEEIALNPRSRSAKLRILEKL